MRWCLLLCLAALLAATAMPMRAAAAPRDRTWPDESLYFIFLDRFANGDKANDGAADPADPRGWHGGDLQGVIDRLDYIKGLGFTAIWITPHVKNTGQDYHGYGAVDFFTPDPHFGTLAKVRELVEHAHARGLKVIFDIVVNHTGPASPLLKAHPDWFHPRDAISDWNDDRQVQDGWLFDLPDFDQSNPDVRAYILGYSRFWIEQTGVDGFRLDTVRHVPPEFFRWYSAELQKVQPGFWLIGEVWQSWPEPLARYQEAGVTALLDFPISEAARNAFGKDGSMATLADKIADVGTVMPDPRQMGLFLDNHDMKRFVTYAQDDQVRRLKLGLAFLFTQRSIPILYYGTEIALPGGDDPDNRADFPWGNEEHADVRDLVGKLNALRRDHPALRRGTVANLLATQAVYAYGRREGSDQVVVVLNNDDSQPLDRDVDLSGMALPDGTILEDALTGTAVTVIGGQIRARVGPRAGAIYTLAISPRMPGVLWSSLAALGVLSAAAILRPRRRRRAA